MPPPSIFFPFCFFLFFFFFFRFSFRKTLLNFVFVCNNAWHQSDHWFREQTCFFLFLNIFWVCSWNIFFLMVFFFKDSCLCAFGFLTYWVLWDLWVPQSTWSFRFVFVVGPTFLPLYTDWTLTCLFLCGPGLQPTVMARAAALQKNYKIIIFLKRFFVFSEKSLYDIMTGIKKLKVMA